MLALTLLFLLCVCVCKDEYVGSFCVHVKHDTDEQLVLAKVTNLFSSFIKHLTVQIEKEDLYFQ